MKTLGKKFLAAVCVLALLLSFAAPMAMAASVLEIRQLPNRLAYANGETLDMTGLQLVLVDDAGNERNIPKTAYTYSPERVVGLGMHTVTVRYNSYVATFEVEVTGEGLWPEIDIVKPSSTSLDFKKTMTLKVKTMQVPAGYHVQWSYEYSDLFGTHPTTLEANEITIEALGNAQTVIVRARLVNAAGNELLGPDGSPLEDSVSIRFNCQWYIKLLYYFNVFMDIVTKLMG